MGWDYWAAPFVFGGIGVFAYLTLMACEYQCRTGLQEIRELLKKRAAIEKQKRLLREEILAGRRPASLVAMDHMAQEKPRAVVGLIEKMIAEKQVSGPLSPPPTGKPGATAPGGVQSSTP